MKRHLLYIAFWYPPSRASGVYRAVGTVRQFTDAGWEVTVITGTRDFLEDEVGSTDTSLVDELPGVEVVRVPFTFDVDPSLDVRSLGWLSANLPALWSLARHKTAPLRSFFRVMGGASPLVHDFTDNYVAWIDPVVKAGLKISSKQSVDHILATGNPYSSFEAARLLAGILGVPFSVDYRDPWTIDVFTGNSEVADRRTRAAERRIVDEARLCFHVNQEIADAYKALYPELADKQIVVPNGYDADSIPELPTPAAAPYRFGILGTLNDRWPIRPVFDAWSQAQSDLPPGSQLLLGGHLGYFERSADLLEAYLPDESDTFRFVGPVAKADVADFYRNIDVLILPVPGGSMVTSGKVYEAMALGIPLICVQAEDGGARRLLQNHPLTIGVEAEAHQVRSAILQAAEMARDLDPQISQRVRNEASVFERQEAMSPLVDEVEAIFDHEGHV